MSDEYVEYLKNDEGRIEIALRLFDYARSILTRDHNWHAGVMLPGGIDPENIVFEIFNRIARGKRKLNKKFDYETQLKGMVKSFVSTLYKKTDAKLETMDLPEDDPSYPKIESALSVGGFDSLFETEECSRRFFEMLEAHPKVQKDSDLGLVILAYADGATGPKEVFEATGIPVKRIYEYDRNLISILNEVQTKLKEKDE